MNSINTCSFCNTSFNNRYDLNLHVHTNKNCISLRESLKEIPQECPNCHQVFNKITILEHSKRCRANTNLKTAALNNRLNEQTTTLNNVKCELSEKQSLIDDLQYKLSEKDNIIKKLDDRVKSKENEVTQLTNDLNIFKLKVEDLDEQNTFRENEVVILKDRIKEIENDLETLNSVILERDNEVLSLKDKLNEKEEEVTDLSDRLKDIERDLETLNSTVMDRDKEISLLKYKIDEKEEELIKKINKIKEEYANNQSGNIVESMDSVIQDITTISDTVDGQTLDVLENEVKELVVKAKKGRKKKGET